MDELKALIAQYPLIETGFWLSVLVIAALLVNFVLKVALVRGLNRLIKGFSFVNGAEMVEAGIIARLANAAPAMVVSSWITAVPGLPNAMALVIRNVANAFIILVIAMAISAILTYGERLWQRRNGATGRSIKGYVQIVTIAVYGFAAMLMIAAVIDRSPLILLSGLGALTAVLMLVFQDTLLSLVASVQISSTDLVRVGDWIEMPSMNADGALVELSLYSATVRNWDNTFSTFPVRKLVSDPFKNWRGMTESGGRRIKRALHIDQNTVHFLSPDEVARLSGLRRLKSHITEKTQEIDSWNALLGDAAVNPGNRRRLTNLGLFRAYVQNYLTDHPRIRSDMTLLVRQMPPGPEGLPIEIYCFTATVAWAEYEGIQSDIFDHLIAILPEFGLSVFQSPAGRDFTRALAGPDRVALLA